ncbi:MAG: Rrf2 family transcriptional regulator [Blautia sp.]|nr:Rrf2 family transcriptional regulator [Lachnoclostridium sp.]MCM1212730.1 Rrf2 family transcriptional regulator [Blautia sp.]
MKISTRGRYSFRMMIDLAQHYNEGFIALKDISARQNISKKYLEQIIPFLNRNNLLLANKGHMGGYQLARHPSEITVREILESAEGSLTPVSCMENTPNRCENANNCITLPVYQGLYKVILDYLNGITLADVINRKNDNCEYYI